MTETVPLREGLFEERARGPVLLASTCGICGQSVFPATDRCLACGGRSQEGTELGPEGALLCATVVHMASGHFEPGYTVGYVELQHGVRVFGQIAASADLPTPGTTMRIEIAPMWREDGKGVLAYQFRAVGKEADDA